jgi:hypothetical protein
MSMLFDAHYTYVLIIHVYARFAVVVITRSAHLRRLM